MVLFRYAYIVSLLAILPCMAQQPLIFDVSTVVVGPQKVETLWAFAEGKWSDAGADVAINSTDIHCYKRFGFCEVASASNSSRRLASVSLSSFDILRWDTTEMIAVDSSPICVVNTLRFDLAAKKVSISSASKGETRDKVCNLTPSMTGTAFLTGVNGESEPKKK